MLVAAVGCPFLMTFVYSFSNEGFFYLAMELAKGDLFYMVSSRRHVFDIYSLQFVMSQLLIGVKYLLGVRKFNI